MNLRLIRPEAPLEVSIQPRPRRRWRDKFREAFRGVKLGVRGQSSFFVHFFCATLVVVTAAGLQCGLMEWCLLIGCIGLVITAELFNSAIEGLVRGLDATTRDRCIVALEIAAGGVLAASATAAVVGGIVLGSRIWQLFVGSG